MSASPKRKHIRGGSLWNGDGNLVSFGRQWLHRDVHEKGRIVARLVLDHCSPDLPEVRSEFFREFLS